MQTNLDGIPPPLPSSTQTQTFSPQKTGREGHVWSMKLTPNDKGGQVSAEEINKSAGDFKALNNGEKKLSLETKINKFVEKLGVKFSSCINRINEAVDKFFSSIRKERPESKNTENNSSTPAKSESEKKLEEISANKTEDSPVSKKNGEQPVITLKPNYREEVTKEKNAISHLLGTSPTSSANKPMNEAKESFHKSPAGFVDEFKLRFAAKLSNVIDDGVVNKLQVLLGEGKKTEAFTLLSNLENKLHDVSVTGNTLRLDFSFKELVNSSCFLKLEQSTDGASGYKSFQKLLNRENLKDWKEKDGKENQSPQGQFHPMDVANAHKFLDLWIKGNGDAPRIRVEGQKDLKEIQDDH